MTSPGRPPVVPAGQEGRLPGCGSAPNCVSSFGQDPHHYVSPLAYSDTPEAALDRLRAVVAAMPGARIVLDDPQRLRVEYTSRLFRFVDDVDFLLDPVHRRIHIRSASRVGYYDFGANRRRVEEIRALFNARRNGRTE